MKPRIDPSTRTVLEPAEATGSARAHGAPRSAFVELCARSTFSGVVLEGIGTVEGKSFLDAEVAWPGAGQPEQIVARAALFEQDAVAVVDVDTLAGVVRAYSAGKELGVRTVVGCELLLDEGPLVVLCESAQGYTHLNEILTLAKRDISKDDVAHDLGRVLARAEGLFAIVMTPVHDEVLAALQTAFGERLSLAVAFHDVPDDALRFLWAQRASARTGVPLVLTARPFLVDAADKRLHDVLTCIRQHLTLETAGQRLLPNTRAHMLDAAGVRARALRRLADIGRDQIAGADALVDRAIARSRQIADACTFELGALRYAFPRSRGREGPAEDLNAVLLRDTFAGAAQRYPYGIPDDVREQLHHELRLIADLDVAAYFLTVKDIVDIARERAILCQGRGSAANSAVCYCLGITSIDPVRMGLLFERFISKERGEPPDIDVDFEHERREEVIQEIYARYGRDHAVLVSEVIAYRGRSAVREVGKVFGLTETLTAAIANLMLHSSFREMSKPQMRQALLAAQLDPDDWRIRRTLEMSGRLQGHPRHLGIHVGGFVLTDAPLATLGPVEPARMEARTVLCWDKDDVDALGLFKMDVLGLGMLTCIRKCLTLVKEHEGTDYALHTIPAEDPRVYAALSKADTIGVFQIESRAQMAMLPRLKPTCFYDLVVEVAIIRPGPIQGGMVHPYLRRRNGEEKVEYPHPSLEPILARTLGVPLFQEQVMKLAVVGAGYTPGEADQLRRDMAAWRKTGRLERHHDRLLAGFTARGISAEFAERLFEQIKGFGEYGFPESHAASFAILVYASAWLKTYFPGHFACALLNSLPMGFYAPAQIISDAQRHGVPVRPACVNHSTWDCTLEGDIRDGAAPPMRTRELRMGLRLIKGLREVVAHKLVQERTAHGPFVDVSDVIRRLDLDKRSRHALARAGAFDALASHRRAAVWAAMDKQLPLLQRERDPDVRGTLHAPAAGEVLLLDYATVGLSLDDHPMVHVRPGLVRAIAAEVRAPGHTPRARAPLLDSRGVARAIGKTRARTAGLVIGRQRPGTADGTCFVTLEDEHGMVNVIIWGRDFDKWRHTVVTAQFLLVEGLIEREGLVVHMIAQAVASVSPPRGAFQSTRPRPGDAAPSAQLRLPFVSRDFH